MLRRHVRSAGLILITSLLHLGHSSAQEPQQPPRPEPSQQQQQPQLPSISLPEPLARVLIDYETAWRNKDAAALAALFTEDGFVLSNGAPPVRGRLQIQKHYTGQGGPLALRAFAYATEGTVGYLIGGYSGQAGKPDEGKFTLTLRKSANEHWLIMSDMDNGNSRR